MLDTSGDRLASIVRGLCAGILLIGYSILIPHAVCAEDEAEQDRYSVSELGLNFDVPESPAFTVLGLNPQNVTRSATPRDFASAVINGLDKNGNFQSGLAIEFNPWGLTNRNFFDSETSIPMSAEGTREGYADGRSTLIHTRDGARFMRSLIYRTSFSLATTKGSQEDDKSLRLAAGVRVTPWDPGDSRLLMGNCLRGKIKSLRGMIDLSTSAPDQLSADLTAAAAGLRQHGRADAADRALLMSTGIVVPGQPAKPGQLATLGLTPGRRAELFEALTTIEKHIAVKDVGSDKILITTEIATVPSAIDQGGVDDILDDVQRRITELIKTIKAYEEGKKKSGVGAGDSAGAAEKALGLATTDPNDTASEADKLKDKAAKAAADNVVDQCRAEEKGRWNGSSWDIALAPSWISQDGSTGSMRWNGGGVWSSLSIGSDIIDIISMDKAVGERRNYAEKHYAQFILHGRYRFKEREAEPSSATTTGTQKDFTDQNTWLVGARWRFLLPTEASAGNNNVLAYLGQGIGVSLEASLSSTNITETAKKLRDDTYLRWAIVPTLRVAENVWIDVAIGTESGRKGSDQGFVLTSLKYGYGEGPWPSHRNHDTSGTDK